MSELDLETIVDRMMREYKLEVNIGKPRVIYRETIRSHAEAEGRYIRSIGGSGNCGHAKIRIEPNQPGDGYEFSNDIRGGVIPQEYIQPIDQGIQAAMAGGVLAGCKMIDIKVSLRDGSYHDVDSNEMAFRIAGSMAFKEAARKANPVLLEPVVAVAVTAPEQYTGTIVADLDTRRGRIEGMEMVRGLQRIRAVAPLSAIVGYATAAGSSTQGRANVSIQFLRYEPAFGGAEPGGEGPAVTVGSPGRPRPRSGSSYARLDAE
jgi:elongation factor G